MIARPSLFSYPVLNKERHGHRGNTVDQIEGEPAI